MFYNLYQYHMPGSYRSLTSLLKLPKQEKVKEEEERLSESQSSLVVNNPESWDGKWTLQQNLKFAIFIHYYQNIFASKRKRKMCKIFKSLAEHLERRTSTQCRSHFQKMIAKHKSIARLKRHYRSTFGLEAYNKEFSDFKRIWEQTHRPMEVAYPELRESKEVAIQTEEPEPVPELCANCQNRQENNLNYSQFYPYQFNPYMFWPNGDQEGLNGNPFMPWMPNNDHQGHIQ